MTCTRCSLRESVEYSGWCRECRNEYAREHYARNRSKRTALARERYAESDRKWAYNLFRNYGLTADDYFALLESQDNKCAICGGEPSGRITRLVVDHDHETGRVRGLLCAGCNHVLGNAKDDPCRLMAAATYLIVRSTVMDWVEGGPAGYKPRSLSRFSQ